mgnify:FL=1
MTSLKPTSSFSRALAWLKDQKKAGYSHLATRQDGSVYPASGEDIPLGALDSYEPLDCGSANRRTIRRAIRLG